MIEFLKLIRTEIALALIDSYRAMNWEQRIEYGIMWIYQVLVIFTFFRTGFHLQLDMLLAILFALVSHRQWQILNASRRRHD
jgi:hypothetical protein